MVYLIITSIGLLFMAIGYILTENNAPQLLSGYNTMPKEKQKLFNLKGFIPFFRKFHLILGISTIVFSIITYQINETYLPYVLCGYPILAYAYFYLKSRSYYNKNWNQILFAINWLKKCSNRNYVPHFHFI